jgi:NAD(P)-dependent dehydrogenase (short-subunit alcohol dehydrogenase family)
MQETMEDALISLNNAKQELDFTKHGEDAQGLQAALEEAAAAYKALHIKACGAGVPVPRSALIQSNEASVWTKEDLIGARDWMKFEDAGWVVMEDLPELPDVFDTTFYVAHNQGDPPEAIVPIGALRAALHAARCVLHFMLRSVCAAHGSCNSRNHACACSRVR